MGYLHSPQKFRKPSEMKRSRWVHNPSSVLFLLFSKANFFAASRRFYPQKKFRRFAAILPPKKIFAASRRLLHLTDPCILSRFHHIISIIQGTPLMKIALSLGWDKAPQARKFWDCSDVFVWFPLENDLQNPSQRIQNMHRPQPPAG